MLINYELNAIFFHSVKCGGNFCKNLLREYNFIDICQNEHEKYSDFIDEADIKHMKDKHTIRKFGKYRYFYSHQNCNKEYMNNYFKFTFVRNPYSKLLSAYMYLKRRMENDNNTIRGLKDNPDYYIDFKNFVKNYKNVNNISFYHAFIPQYEHILDFSLNSNFQYIGKIENFNDELINIFSLLGLKELKCIDKIFNGEKRNETNYEKNVTEYFDEHIFSFVNHFFEKDFESFGYKKYDTFEEFKTLFDKEQIKIMTPIDIVLRDVPLKISMSECTIENENSVSIKDKKSIIPHYYIKIPSKIEKKIQSERGQLIPRIIIQTYKNNYLHPQIYDNIMNILKNNPSYDYYFINDEDGEKLIERYFDERTLIAFKKLKVGAAKGDFIRMIALYLYGGVYLDLDASIKIDLDQFIQPNNEYIFLYDANKCQITNWCMMNIQKHIIIKKIIDEMVNRILENKEINILIITGPYLVTDVIYNHFTGLDIYNVYEEIHHHTFFDFILKYRDLNIFHETYYLCEKLNFFDFRFDGYDKKMLYYDEVEYDNIIDFNVYKNKILKKQDNIDSCYFYSNTLYFIYLNMLKNNGVKKYTKKLLELFDIIKKKYLTIKKVKYII